VTQGGRAVGYGNVSPDGQWIVFRSTDPQEDLFVVHPDGSGLRQLTRDLAKDRGATWLPDGRILFFSDRSGRYEAWSIRPDGSGLEPLTATRGEPIYTPLASPDGRRLVCGLGFTGMALIDLTRPLAGRVPQRLPFGGVEGRPFFATSWSPDGRRLAGNVERQGLFLYDLAGRRYERLLDHGAQPVWMRDGRRLLYLDDGRVRVLDTATRESRDVLVPPPGSAYSAVDLSGDERTLYVARLAKEGDVWLLTLQAPQR